MKKYTVFQRCAKLFLFFLNDKEAFFLIVPSLKDEPKEPFNVRLLQLKLLKQITRIQQMEKNNVRS